MRPPSPTPDTRLILREEELDASVELFVLAEAALWSTAEAALQGHPSGLGRGHYRAAFLLKRRPGIGVHELAQLTGLSKQGASRVLSDLERCGYIAKAAGKEDARRRPAQLTAAGRAFETKVSERLRNHLALAYRSGGLDAVPGARRILASVAGSRLTITAPGDGDGE
jgi:DNA-binding MarR family transcriptional regulator